MKLFVYFPKVYIRLCFLIIVIFLITWSILYFINETKKGEKAGKILLKIILAFVAYIVIRVILVVSYSFISDALATPVADWEIFDNCAWGVCKESIEYKKFIEYGIFTLVYSSAIFGLVAFLLRCLKDAYIIWRKCILCIFIVFYAVSILISGYLIYSGVSHNGEIFEYYEEY